MMEREVTKPKNLGATIRRFLAYFREGNAWAGLLLVAVFVVGSTWASVTAPDYVGQAVDCYLFARPAAAGQASSCWYADEDINAITARIQADPSIPEADKQGEINAARIRGLGSIVLILAVLYFLASALTGLSFFTIARTGQYVLLQIRKQLFRHLTRLSLGFYGETEAGNLMSRITSDTDTIQQTLNFALINVVSGVLTLVWIGVKMLQANVPYALLSLAVAPFMLLATVYFSSQARKAFRRSRRAIGSVNADLQESISGVREVQAFSREEENIEDFKKVNAANRDANIRAASYTSALTPILEALGYVGLGIVVVVGGLSVLRDQPLLGTTVISLGTVIAFMQYVQRFNQPIQQIAVLWTNIQSAIAGAERIFGLLDTPADVVDKPNANVMPAIQGRVVFDNVKAQYKEDEPVLRGVSFTAEPGQTIAVVGPTGAGKTTIINLIPRFYDVTGGAVTIDGIDVRDVKLASLRDQIGIVLQDTFLFSDTVMNNIRYGKLDATDEEVIAAAKLVAADTFIERLPDGYQTVLGERGAGLSQGQRQLLSIARAALKDPRILILDEATSSVDTRTERLIQAALEKIMHGRTSFVIAHRLSTVRHASTVLVIKDGDIVERGTHEELLAAKGAYYDLYMSQFLRPDVSNGSGNGNGSGKVNGVANAALESVGND
ncbi:MAG: ABC transporter ATP-binding protein [Anaerolineae bacterium]|nr:ABC transporter ATP-binding protein [Anaerolineae bacterium]